MVRGIIPARAGFTGIKSTINTVASDHPRSRGVYDPNTNTDTFIYGSSPLARGLLAAVNHTLEFGVDHPRSRGVYSPVRP